MRGQRTAYRSLFTDEEIAMPVAEKKGRNEQLIAQRNELLIYRHYYYIKIRRRQFGDTLKSLSNEFHITERTILDVFQKTNLLREIRQKDLDVAFFKAKYPHLIW